MSLKKCISTNPEQMYEFLTVTANIIEAVTGKKFGSDGILFIQDSGKKEKNNIYIDKTTLNFIEVLKDTYAEKMNTEDFKLCTLPVIGSGEGGTLPAPTIKIEKIYSSLTELESGFATDNLNKGAFVIINTGDVSDEDNAKLFIKGETQYEFLTDLSGAPGVQGPAGKDGAPGKDGVNGKDGKDGIQGPAGKDGTNGVDGAPGVQGPAGKDGADGVNGKDGKDGIQGPAGPAGMNGFTVKLTKNATHIQSQFVGERAIQGVFYPAENETPITVVASAPFATLKRIFINNIPDTVKSVRLNTVVFTFANDSGKVLGSVNPSFGRPSGTFPELGTLDPSLGTKYKVRGGQCSIKPTFDTESACAKQMEAFNRVTGGEKATKVSMLEFDFVHLDAEDRIIGKTDIREHFMDSIDGKPTNLVAIADLKGKSAYEIAKENSTTTAQNEEEFAKELSQVKNIKDNSMYDIWIGTTDEFALIGEESMKDKTLYHVIDASTGKVTITTKK